VSYDRHLAAKAQGDKLTAYRVLDGNTMSIRKGQCVFVVMTGSVKIPAMRAYQAAVMGCGR
jgi:hypothetical protein